MIKTTLCFLVILSSQILFAQSRKDVEKERELYRSNKVKTEIIDHGSGNKTVVQFDIYGKKTEAKGFYNNIESNITGYEYDEKSNLIVESYFGYESGDGVTSQYKYDEAGNNIQIKTEGSDANEVHFKFDEQGNIVQSRYVDIALNPGPDYILEYNNTYENGNLVSKENLCNQQNNTVTVTKYTYEDNKLKAIEEFEKNCSDNSLKFISKEEILYSANGLVKERTYRSVYDDGIKKSVYSYVFYE